jgi:H+/Cl- antiporter ClcA
MPSPTTSQQSDFATDSRLLRLALLAAGIGACGTVAAFVLIRLIHFFTNLFFFQQFSLAFHSPAGHTLGRWVIALPVVGGLIVGVLARFGSEKIRGHGIPEAIEAILFGKSKMSLKVALLKPISSGIAIGSGGPFGAEGPIIMTGGAIGSLIAQNFHLTAAERKTLLVAGATAGMTAIFGTPLAAVLLAVELLLFEWRPRSVIPVAVACVVAAFTRPLLLESGPLFPMQTPAVTLAALPSCLIAGLACGALGALLTVSLYAVEDAFHKIKLHWMWWPAIGGLVVGIGGFLQPRALGVGYDVIGDLLQNRLLLGAALAILTVKAIIWVVALGSGTSGGVLAPLLMLGAGLGAVLSHVLPGGGPMLWPLVCMAGILAGVMRVPLTAVAFAFELTQDVNALLPLLATAAVAYAFTVRTMKRSILTEKIARRGFHIYREYGVDPMERTEVATLMSQHVTTIDADLPIGEAMARHFGADQRHRAYPVVDGAGHVVGVLDRALLENPPLAATSVGQLFADPPLFALPGEMCRSVAARLSEHQLERLPVVTDAKSRTLVGIIARSDLVKPAFALFEEEAVRERLVGTI